MAAPLPKRAHAKRAWPELEGQKWTFLVAELASYSNARKVRRTSRVASFAIHK